MLSNRAIVTFFGFLFITLTVLTFGVRADQWTLPKKQRYYAPNKKYYLEVTPKKLESQLQYFEDNVNHKDNAGAVRGVKDNRAKGAFYARRSDGPFSKKSEFPLVNEVSPVSALVSNDGNYFVTFDNWHSMGYGDDVVVLYRSDGSVIKKFGLVDLLTEGDIETLPRSISSIWWGGDHYIDDAAEVLVLKIVSNRKSPWEDAAQFHELKVELANGRTLEPKRDLFPQPRVFVVVEAQTADAPSEVSPGKPACSTTTDTFDSSGATQVSPEQLLAKAKERPLPPYPPIARAAHAEGTVVIEIVVSAAGEIVCARSLAGHPLLRTAATSAVLKWKFEPFESANGAAKVIGTIAINFTVTEKDMNPGSSRNRVSNSEGLLPEQETNSVRESPQETASTQCNQSATEQNSQIAEAQREKFTVRRVEFWGLTYIPDRKLREKLGPFLNEGDLFSAKKLVRSLQSMSEFKKDIYPVRMKDVELYLNRSERTIDMLICFKPRHR
jgi:TonB family protein